MPEESGMKKPRDMEVWQKAHQLVLEVYRKTRGFPPEEKTAPAGRMRRAAAAPKETAKGSRRKGRTNKANFNEACQACLEELRKCRLAGEEMDFARETERAMLLVDRIARALQPRAGGPKGSL